MYFFTADEHYGHANIIRYCDRPFGSVEVMDEELIRRHNSVVKSGDAVIHAGDFTLRDKVFAWNTIARLNGSHFFLVGSHDRWLPKNTPYILENTINGVFMVVCHYAMRTWRKSHYNSIHLYGHSHGRLDPIGKQWDIGVDNNNFYPLSFDDIVDIMKSRPDNPNLIRKVAE